MADTPNPPPVSVPATGILPPGCKASYWKHFRKKGSIWFPLNKKTLLSLYYNSQKLWKRPHPENSVRAALYSNDYKINVNFGWGFYQNNYNFRKGGPP